MREVRALAEGHRVGGEILWMRASRVLIWPSKNTAGLLKPGDGHFTPKTDLYDSPRERHVSLSGASAGRCLWAFSSSFRFKKLVFNLFQTHFLNVWRRKWPSPSGSMCPKFGPIPTFFDQATPTVFDPRDPQAHFSKKYSPAKIVLFVRYLARYLSLKSPKSFSLILRLQERAAGPV